MTMASAQKILPFFLSSARASLMVLGSSMPNLTGPFQMTQIAFSYKRYNAIPLPQDVRNPPV
jgi:hypothetical protein